MNDLECKRGNSNYKKIFFKKGSARLKTFIFKRKDGGLVSKTMVFLENMER